MAFNKVILMGRLTADPELKQTQSGTAVTSFSLAVDRKYNKDEEKKCDFITIVAWKQTAEFICKYFKKGSAILLCGELQTRSWKDNQGNTRYATEVLANEVSFCEAKNNSEGDNTPNTRNGSQRGFSGSQGYMPDAFQPNAGDDDLPF
jgi:single-strand DNA-binding protein